MTCEIKIMPGSAMPGWAAQHQTTAMLQPHFWNFPGNNRILVAAAIVRANWGRIRFGSFQSPG
jgi:hypothetical protein